MARSAIPRQTRTIDVKDRANALDLLFGGGAEGRVGEAEELLAGGGEAAEFLIGAYVEDRLVGVAWAQPIGVDAALVSTPRLVEGESTATCECLIGALENALRLHGRRFTQALVAEEPDCTLLQRVGFQRLTQLVYLVLQGEELAALGDLEQDESLEFVEQAGAVDTDRFQLRFREVVAQTYRETLDCPELNGVRSTADTLQGYRSTGRFDPRLWMIAVQRGQDVGCCAMTWHGDEDVELLYYGVIDGARGRGLGERILRAAAAAARNAGAQRLITAVDGRNRPAIAQYCQLRFGAWAHRHVFVKNLASESAERLASAMSSDEMDDAS